jgi:hypothetical protein
LQQDMWFTVHRPWLYIQQVWSKWFYVKSSNRNLLFVTSKHEVFGRWDYLLY